MERTAILATLLAAAGCDGGGPGAAAFPVTVTVHDDDGAPRAGLRVVFGAPDGSSTEAFTDAAGEATADVEAGAAAWVFEQVFSDVHVTGLLGLAEGDAPLFGRAEPVAVHAPVARVMVTGAPPAAMGAASLVAGSRCGRGSEGGGPAMTSELALDARCLPATDVLAVAYERGDDGDGPHVVGFALLPGQAISDGATVRVPDEAWRPPVELAVRLTGAPDGVYVDRETWLTDDFATRIAPTDGVGGTVRAFVPLVGDRVRMQTTFHRDALQQQVVVELPAVAAQDLDTTALLAPWVTQSAQRGPVRWWGNDDGGALKAGATVLTQETSIVDPIGQTLRLTVRTIARALPPTELPLPSFPDGLASYQPAYVERTRLQLVRLGDRTPAEYARLADGVAAAAVREEVLPPLVVPAAVSQTVGAGD